MQIPAPVYEGARGLLEKTHGKRLVIKDFSFSGGGCINHGGKLKTSRGDFFLKWNDAGKFPKMFDAEARGLNLLARADAIRIPVVIGSEENGGYQFLLLEFINSSPRSNDYWSHLGRQLAQLHHNHADHFGLDHENYIGSLPQSNRMLDSWADFFIQERLNIQLKLGIDSKVISTSYIQKFEQLYKILPSILPEEKPSFLHGDLWSGNLITDEKGHPCLIDPAVYYGHREVDLAMTQLFGGFGSEFYDAYQEAVPSESGLQQRLDIYTLYPLLVHVNLFGQSYLRQVDGVLRTYAK